MAHTPEHKNNNQNTRDQRNNRGNMGDSEKDVKFSPDRETVDEINEL